MHKSNNNEKTTNKRSEPVQLQHVLNQFSELFSEYYSLESSSSLQADSMITDIIIPDVLSTLSWTVFSCLIRHIFYSAPLCFLYDFIPVPKKLINDMAPGFIFASMWLVSPITKKFKSSPLISTRVCETVMGRLNLYELAVIIPIHFLSAVLGVTLSYSILKLSSFEAISYNSDTSWLIALIREIFINTMYCVSALVLPEIFKLNKLPTFLIPTLMIPVYMFSVDSSGKGSSFAPEMIYAFTYLLDYHNKRGDWYVSFHQSPHLLGPLIGGFVAGKIMNIFFPDAK